MAYETRQEGVVLDHQEDAPPTVPRSQVINIYQGVGARNAEADHLSTEIERFVRKWRLD
jgi:squalene cyclase